MPIVVSPSEADIEAAVYGFLTSILSCLVVRGQSNRVPQPAPSDFAVFTAIDRRRLETNVDTGADVFFDATISGTTMTVTQLFLGTISAGATLFGTGVVAGSTVGQQLSGSIGGTGTYAVSPSQSMALSGVACGALQMTQETEVTFQIDVYGPSSADNAQIVSTLWRDNYATDAFALLNPAVSPLYADDPRQAPFIDAEKQYETRWMVQACLQASQTTSVPQQYASTVSVTLIEVP